MLLDTLIDNNFISFLEYAEHETKLTFQPRGRGMPTA